MGFAEKEFSIYLQKIQIDPALKVFFLSNHRMKGLFLFGVTKKSRNKKMISFYWNLFAKIYYFYNFHLAVESLKIKIEKLEEITKYVNLIVFIWLLLFYFHLPEVIFAILTVFVFLLIARKIFDSYFWLITDTTLIKNKSFVNVFEKWFLEFKLELLKIHSFLSNSDLVYPYINQKSPKLLLSEYLELFHIVDTNEKNDFVFQGFAEFSTFSDYLLTEEETLELQKAEDFVISWYSTLVADGIINPVNCEFDEEKAKKLYYTPSN